ncbi:nucleotidyltransferase domain-containing protein [Candidatus Pacearchaeota archaeon]|nr:nucleotidyltransferase domain-containing protein [Candidatus Pacearchaeota archaeon]
MIPKTIKHEIKKDFGKFKNESLGVLVYGSYATENSTPKSDIDICIIAGNIGKAREIYRDTLIIQGKKPKYDIHIFELMPLYMQIKVMKEGEVILSKSLSELSYYFYSFEKLWEEQAIHRV